MSSYDYEVYTIFRDSNTPFNELRTAEFTPIIELDSSNGLTDLRDNQTTTNSGSISNTGGEHKLSTGTTASSTAQLDTAEKGRYQPGIVGLGGIGVRRPTAPTGNQVWEAGYFDDNDGVFIGEDSTGIYLELRSGGSSVKKVYQNGEDGGDKWNLDTVDGGADSENRSAENLDLSHPTVVRFPLVWYFGGPIRVEILVANAGGGESQTIPVHEFASTADQPIIQQPKLPVRARVDNGGDTNNLDLFVGGRQFAVLGRYKPNRRETSEFRLSVSTSTTVTPLVSFKKKSGADTHKSVKISGLAVTSDTNSLVEIHLNPTGLTNSNFGSVSNIPDSETAVQSDTSATAITAGQILDRTLVSGGQGNSFNTAGIRRLGFDVPDDATITIAVRTVSGTGTASAVFSVEEEW